MGKALYEKRAAWAKAWTCEGRKECLGALNNQGAIKPGPTDRKRERGRGES